MADALLARLARKSSAKCRAQMDLLAYIYHGLCRYRNAK